MVAPEDALLPLDSEWVTQLHTHGSFHDPGATCPAVTAYDTTFETHRTLRECLKKRISPCGHCVPVERVPPRSVVLSSSTDAEAGDE